MCAAGLISAFVALTAVSAPPPKNQVDELIRQGIERREKGEDAAALELFRQAYELSRGPKALAQMALAEVALGRWLEAEGHLKVALESTEDKYVKTHRSTLEGAMVMVQQHLGHLDVMGNVNGANVFVDGKAVGTLPFAAPLRVVAGKITLDVSATGYRPISRSVIVNPGTLARETVELSLIPSEPPAAAAPKPAPAPVTTAAPPPADSTLRTLGWVSAGLAGAGLVLGIVEWRVREGHASAYNDLSCPSDPKCAEEQSSADSATTLMAVGFVATGVFAAASVTLFVLAPSPEPSAAPPVTASIGLGGPGEIGASLTGRF